MARDDDHGTVLNPECDQGPAPWTKVQPDSRYEYASLERSVTLIRNWQMKLEVI